MDRVRMDMAMIYKMYERRNILLESSRYRRGYDGMELSRL